MSGESPYSGNYDPTGIEKYIQDVSDGFDLGFEDAQRGIEPRFGKEMSDFSHGYLTGYDYYAYFVKGF